MTESMIEIERQGAVATVWMNRPDLHNAFNEGLITELTAAFTGLNDDVSVRVLVLAGRGKSFSAGGDLNWMKRQGEAPLHTNIADAVRLASLFRILAEMRKPTVARVQGAALAGGMGLAAACDICVASDKAQFAVTEVRVGLIAATIGPYVLRAIGERQATRYFQSAERINANRAWQLGLVHEVVTADALDAKVQEIVEALLQGGLEAQAASKELIRAIAHQPVTDTLLHDTAKRIAMIRANPEAKEGVTSFLEKRVARWAPGA